ncbi:TRUD domain-containing protein [Aphelenchoides bicaudatus]|nr:TRUD domain-containing protein [Aphelenchoides bicaudatus]
MFRPEIGVTAFLNDQDGNSWPCLFKHLQSDFVVQEILDGGKVCEITAEPQIYTASEANVENVPAISIDPPAKFTEEMKKQLAEFRGSKDLEFSINVQDWSKDERRDLHVYIRSVGGMDSTTKGNEIEISRLGSTRKRRRTEAFQKSYVHFTLAKMDHDTAYAINILGKFLNKNANSFGYCGTKDRRAITAQRVSLFKVEPNQLYKLNARLRGLKISDAKFEDENLALGMACGNRFSIALREFNGDISDDQLRKRINDWENDGFLNYYGDQRFGTWNTTTAQIGQKILQRDWQGTVALILKPIGGSDTQLNAALLKYQETKDAAQALVLVPGTLRSTTTEGKILTYLSTKPKNFKNSLISIPRNVRSLYVHAYQSLVFNKIVSKRAEKYGKQVIDGDLFMVNGEVVEKGLVEDVVLPLPYFPSKFPENEVKDWYMEILEQDGVSKEVFLELKGEFALAESLRKYIEKPRNVNYKLSWYAAPDTIVHNFPPFSETKADEVSEKPTEKFRKALLIQFDLNSGTYATVSLRELLHLDIGKENQRQLSLQVRNGANKKGEEI